MGKVARWVDHCNKFSHWWNQNNTNTAGSDCLAPQDKIIRASWYNACVDACVNTDVTLTKVTGGPNGTIITPGLFSALGEAISKGDPASS